MSARLTARVGLRVSSLLTTKLGQNKNLNQYGSVCFDSLSIFLFQ